MTFGSVWQNETGWDTPKTVVKLELQRDLNWPLSTGEVLFGTIYEDYEPIVIRVDLWEYMGEPERIEVVLTVKP